MGLIEGFFAYAVPVGFGYLFFRLIKPKTDSGNISLDYAQLFFAWSLFISTSVTMPQYLITPNEANLFIWLSRSLAFGLIAFIAGFAYGKFK
jgi:hypothetical protein